MNHDGILTLYTLLVLDPYFRLKEQVQWDSHFYDVLSWCFIEIQLQHNKTLGTDYIYCYEPWARERDFFIKISLFDKKKYVKLFLLGHGSDFKLLIIKTDLLEVLRFVYNIA